MTREEYDKIAALNFSNAKRLRKSGLAFKEGWVPPEDQEHLVVGSMVHAMLLEGRDLRSTYAIKPSGMSFATKEGKAWKAAQSLPILESEAAERVPRIADAIAKNKLARAFIRRCPLREHALVGQINGVKCKGLIDMVGNDQTRNPGFVEIKTLPDCREAYFIKRIVSEPFDYDVQIVWYRRLIHSAYFEPMPPDAPQPEKIWSVWIAAEQRRPFDVAVYFPEDEMLASGEDKLRDIFTTYHACLDANSWPGIQADGKMKGLKPPRWRLKEMEHEYEDY